jgi:hypothetical protein
MQDPNNPGHRPGRDDNSDFLEPRRFNRKGITAPDSLFRTASFLSVRRHGVPFTLDQRLPPGFQLPPGFVIGPNGLPMPASQAGAGGQSAAPSQPGGMSQSGGGYVNSPIAVPSGPTTYRIKEIVSLLK